MSSPSQGARAEVGLSHVALSVRDMQASVAFYERYAGMREVHRRNGSSRPIVWLSDLSRPFVIVLIEVDEVDGRLEGIAHLGIGCESREQVDQLCEQAASESRLLMGPEDAGHPVGYWALLRDPDGHNLELSFGQEVALAVGRAGDDDDTATRPDADDAAIRADGADACAQAPSQERGARAGAGPSL
jgi:catechol 2,3-dioxygenase-like lactoylglutathione lyase family enzyme